MSREIAARLGERLDGRVHEHAPLAPFTTFRAGGPADILVEAESTDDLRAVAEVRGDEPVAIVGRGSNLLVSDKGFRGIAVRLGRAFRHHQVTEEGLRLGGAVYLPAAARLTARLGLEGFEFAAEIPASFGGAVAMNAGAHGREISDVLISASLVDLSTGEARTLRSSDLSYGYRKSSLGADSMVCGGEVRLGAAADPREVGARIAQHLRWRRHHQPPGRSAGSVFKNPAGDSAGRIIDSCGAKGMRVGKAAVSDVHANFIVVEPGASASDVWKLIDRVRGLVLDKLGVDLEPEVRFLGSFPAGSDTKGSH